jgi:hypothetical protein
MECEGKEMEEKGMGGKGKRRGWESTSLSPVPLSAFFFPASFLSLPLNLQLC